MKMNKEEILERLLKMDNDIALIDNTDEQYTCIIVGGSALVVLDKIFRSTHDIDCINASGGITNFLEIYNINMNSRAYITNFPDSYLDRLIKIDIPTKKINFYTLSPEDLVISKLASARKKDKEDIEHETVYKQLDWDLMDKLVKEVCEGLLTDYDCNALQYDYQEYKERFK